MHRSIRLLAAFAFGLPIAGLAGPADYIHVPAVEYGWLHGVGEGSPRNTVRLQAEYEF
ncbi:MAG: hypothetical protein ABIR98_06205 [Usitatibacter sp.]